MEPPLYSDLNRVCRMMDLSKLDLLGAYSTVLYEILHGGAFLESKRDNAMRFGAYDEPNVPYGFYS